MSEIPLSIAEAHEALQRGTLSSVELTTAVIERADKLDALLGTYLERYDEAALASAARADEEIARGVDRGPLHGIPLGVKDILATLEGETTAQSLVHRRAWGSRKDAPVVARLRAAGAVITGKTTTMEFAIGPPDATKPFPIPKNPWNLDRWTGGSSSGTGNGVAAGLFYGGIGTDTGGSIRIPAAFCGISGLMPSYGLVPKSGCVPLASSLDHIGPMARSVRDCAAMLNVMAGYHPSDPDSREVPVPDYASVPTGLAGIRIGVDRSLVVDEGDPGAIVAFEQALDVLRSLGAEVLDITIPLYQEMCAVTMLSVPSEAFAYHRNDMQARWDDYFQGTRNFVTGGALIAAADYVQAQRVRRVAQRALSDVFKTVDAIADITISVGAPVFSAPGTSLAVDFFDFARFVHCIYWNPTGHPVLSVPMGFTADGLPLSLQLGERAFDESTLIRIGANYQELTDWHRRLPPVALEAESTTNRPEGLS
jgi:aspartyl-tRNA(Asn)/glutamyl-tRNA(Gln) amidotransferase subunit A